MIPPCQRTFLSLVDSRFARRRSASAPCRIDSTAMDLGGTWHSDVLGIFPVCQTVLPRRSTHLIKSRRRARRGSISKASRPKCYRPVPAYLVAIVFVVIRTPRILLDDPRCPATCLHAPLERLRPVRPQAPLEARPTKHASAPKHTLSFHLNQRSVVIMPFELLNRDRPRCISKGRHVRHTDTSGESWKKILRNLYWTMSHRYPARSRNYCAARTPGGQIFAQAELAELRPAIEPTQVDNTARVARQREKQRRVYRLIEPPSRFQRRAMAAEPLPAVHRRDLACRGSTRRREGGLGAGWAADPREGYRGQGSRLACELSLPPLNAAGSGASLRPSPSPRWPE